MALPTSPLTKEQIEMLISAPLVTDSWVRDRFLNDMATYGTGVTKTFIWTPPWHVRARRWIRAMWDRHVLKKPTVVSWHDIRSEFVWPWVEPPAIDSRAWTGRY